MLEEGKAMDMKCMQCIINSLAEAAVEGKELQLFPFMMSVKTGAVVAVWKGESYCAYHLADVLEPMWDDNKRITAQTEAMLIKRGKR